MSEAVRKYIKECWPRLTRTKRHLLDAVIDPKVKIDHPGILGIMYIPHDVNETVVMDKLLEKLTMEELAKIRILKLPKRVKDIKQEGLLYLPYPYVVPGGRFNEMYGWDSYFINLGLLESGEVELAKNMVENFMYEIRHYGMVLNANRTYYLQRSQPPFFTRMILDVYDRIEDEDWLASTLPSIKKLYRYWTSGKRRIPFIGLSRYFAAGKGPVPEGLSDEKMNGETYYEGVRKYFMNNPIAVYDVEDYFDKKTKQLKQSFYTADRSIRESGYDLSEKYGPFGAAINEHASVTLNTLLAKMEMDIRTIYDILGDEKQAVYWRNKADKRIAKINKYCWDSASGLYFDYNFKKKKRRHYIFASTFCPLWAGIASKEQAQRVRDNLHELECNGGVLSSKYHTGMQWDSPFIWAPLQIFAVEGLLRYDYKEDALRVAKKYVGMIDKDFERTGTIVEKYNGEKASSFVSEELKIGYESNEIGFGWTNAAYLVLSRIIRENS